MATILEFKKLEKSIQSTEFDEIIKALDLDSMAAFNLYREIKSIWKNEGTYKAIARLRQAPEDIKLYFALHGLGAMLREDKRI